MKSLLAEFDILMNVAGYNSITEINRKALSMALSVCATKNRIHPMGKQLSAGKTLRWR